MNHPDKRARRAAAVFWAFVLLTGLAAPGCEAGKKIIDCQTIVGRWKRQGGSTTLEFFGDGTLVEQRINTGKGRYKFLDGGRLWMEVEGVLWGTNEVFFRYQLSGDELTLTPEGGGVTVALRYVRVR